MIDRRWEGGNRNDRKRKREMVERKGQMIEREKEKELRDGNEANMRME